MAALFQNSTLLRGEVLLCLRDSRLLLIQFDILKLSPPYDEVSAVVNAKKLLRSVGRGVKLPPICDITLPKAYYNELPSHMHMLSKSGLGRGQQMQELTGENRDLERFGEQLVPTDIVPELPVSLEDMPEDDFPVLKSANAEDVVLQDAPCSRPNTEASQMSLKSLAAQFTTVK